MTRYEVVGTQWNLWDCRLRYDYAEFRGKNWERTILLDTFNNEILAHSITDVSGSNMPYYDCLDVLIRLAEEGREGTPSSLPLWSGSCLLFQSFCQAHIHYNKPRSMSPGEPPTENPIFDVCLKWLNEGGTLSGLRSWTCSGCFCPPRSVYFLL